MGKITFFIFLLILTITEFTLARKRVPTHFDGDVQHLVATISTKVDAMLTKLEMVESRMESIESRLTLVEDQHVIKESPVTMPGYNAIPTKYQFSAFGCVSDMISLGCSNGKTIFVSGADFGKISYACTEGCCPPHPGRDCVEPVEESRPQDWLALKFLCDNRTSCQYEYLGSVIDSCEPGYIADYMSIYYTCLPEDDADEAIGFTAVHDYNRAYSDKEIIRFNHTLVNIGGYFQEPSSTFICPFHGLYGFFVSIYNAPGDLILCYIRQENAQVSGLVMENIAGANIHASNMAVVSCAKGDRVYVDIGEGGNAGTIHGVAHRTTFSGFLIHLMN